MKAIILAGGEGTRLESFTKILPKPLTPVGDKPILEILIHQIKHAGIRKFILTVGPQSNLIETYFQDGSHLDVELKYSHESQPLGTAGALSLIEGLNKSFLVTNGDVLSDINIINFMEYHHEVGATATIAMYKKVVNINLGVIHLNGGKQVIGYDEKPSITYPVSMGLYAFEPKVLDYIPKNQHLNFPDLVHRLIKNNEPVFAYEFDGYWRDLGNKEDYEKAMKDFEDKHHIFMPQ